MTEPSLYDQTELIRGRLYRYDPDFDIWRPVPTQVEGPVSRWSWVFVAVALALLAYALEVLR
jgi:hypothetical protein